MAAHDGGQAGDRKAARRRRRGADVATAASGPQAARGQIRRELTDLRDRVAQLEHDIQEARQLSKRLAEVTDVVAEVLLPAEQRDEVRMRELLARYETLL